MKQMEYKEFKWGLRQMNKSLSCSQCREIYDTVYPNERTIPCGSMISLDMLQAEANTIASSKLAMPSGYELPVWENEPMNNNQEGNKPMCMKALNTTSVLAVSAPASVEATQRDFFSARVYQTQEKLLAGLRKQFNMDAKDKPETAKELIKAITDGAYTLDNETLDRAEESGDIRYYNAFYGIRWGKEKPDTTGFTAARDVLKEAAQDVIDAGTLAPTEDLLQLLKDFQEWTYTAEV